MPRQSIQELRLGINAPLTNLTLGFRQPDYCMSILFPLVEVDAYGGQIVAFGDDEYQDVDDTRADDGQYKEIHSSYDGRPFKLNTKGLMFPITDREIDETKNLGINWSQHAVTQLMNKGSLRHEIEATTIATDADNYATTNKITLSGTDQFSDYANSEPAEVIRTAMSAVSAQIGVDPNLMIVGRTVMDRLQEHPRFREQIQYTSPNSITPDLLAGFLGITRVKVSNAIRNINGTKSRIMGKDIVLAYVNPAALNNDKMPYVAANGNINIKEPSFGYTYVKKGHPRIRNPWYNEERTRTEYRMDFDRSVELVGIDPDSELITHGYLIKNAVA